MLQETESLFSSSLSSHPTGGWALALLRGEQLQSPEKESRMRVSGFFSEIVFHKPGLHSPRAPPGPVCAGPGCGLPVKI